MIARTVRTSWQTILADLSLILFMVTASALANAGDGPLAADDPPPRPVPPPPRPAPAAPPVIPSLRAEPVAVWRPVAGGPAIGAWLDEVARDPRLRLTISVRYAPGGRDGAIDQARRLNRAAGSHGESARIVIEPGEPAGIAAQVGYDAETGTGIAGHAS